MTQQPLWLVRYYDIIQGGYVTRAVFTIQRDADRFCTMCNDFKGSAYHRVEQVQTEISKQTDNTRYTVEVKHGRV